MIEFEALLRTEKEAVMGRVEQQLTALLHMGQRAHKYGAALRRAEELVRKIPGATLVTFISYSGLAGDAAHLCVYVYGLKSYHQAAPLVKAFVLALGRSVKEHHRGPSQEVHVENELVKLTFYEAIPVREEV